MQLPQTVDILILGAGWTSKFLIDLCRSQNISFTSTTRSGRDGTIAFTLDPESSDRRPYEILPDATTILITFPITVPGGSANLVKFYKESRSQRSEKTRFIQLGSTSMWGGINRAARKKATENQEPVPQPANEFKWYDRHSDMTPSERSKEEDELLKLYPGDSVTVLNLSGLWGGERLPKNWVGKVAATKEMLQSKGSLHLIHGYDVARAIIAAHKQFGKANGQRWILTDMRCYDWWDLAAVWSSSSSNEDRDDGIREQEDARPQANWVRELLLEQGIRGLPRNVELLGRALDSRDFWEIFGLNPLCYIK